MWRFSAQAEFDHAVTTKNTKTPVWLSSFYCCCSPRQNPVGLAGTTNQGSKRFIKMLKRLNLRGLGPVRLTQQREFSARFRGSIHDREKIPNKGFVAESTRWLFLAISSLCRQGPGSTQAKMPRAGSTPSLDSKCDEGSCPFGKEVFVLLFCTRW